MRKNIRFIKPGGVNDKWLSKQITFSIDGDETTVAIRHDYTHGRYNESRFTLDYFQAMDLVKVLNGGGRA